MGFISADGLIQSEIVVAAHGLLAQQIGLSGPLLRLRGLALIETRRAAPGTNVDYGCEEPLEPRGPLRDDKAKRNHPSCNNSRTNSDTNQPDRTDYPVR